ncbi:MAG: PKD domain-containing protein, partial [Candidatus Auribacterota bacterium]|nr:PKD domain-containing protein [Candidatus Auribacterota bacterium]
MKHFFGGKLFSVRSIFLLIVLSNFLFASFSFAEFKVITVPKNPLKPEVPHSAYNGRRTIFKAVCRETTATNPPGVSGTIYYEWDFNGDGDFSATNNTGSGTLSTTNPYILQAIHTYPNVTTDELKIAVVRAKRAGASNWESYASYPVWIYAGVPSAPNSGTTILANDDQMAVMRDVAIDDALWWLHKNMYDDSLTSSNTNITEAGDTSNQLSNWRLVLSPTSSYYPIISQTAGWKLYWRIVNNTSTNTRTVYLYKTVSTATAELVAQGAVVNNGQITLTPRNNSGLRGFVNITYVADATVNSGRNVVLKKATTAFRGYIDRIFYEDNRTWSAPDRQVATNALIMWAFQIQGHLPAYPPGTTGVPAHNSTYWENTPYSETVWRMLSYVLNNLATENITDSADEYSDGNPRAGAPNGKGLCVRAGLSGRTYDTTVTLGGLSLCGLQGTTAKVGIATYVNGRKIEDIIQDLVDWVVMAQHDNGGVKGGWYYQQMTTDANTSGAYMDASTAQWAYIGLEAAETTMGSAGVYVNNRCKNRIPFVLQSNQHKTAGTDYGAAQYRNNYTNPGTNYNTANFQLSGGAIVACAWLGWDTFPLSGAGSTDKPYLDQGFNLTKAQCRQIYNDYFNYIGVNWLEDLFQRKGQYNNGDWWSSSNQGGTYAMYSIQKGLRTLSDEPRIVATHDWFQEYSTYYINNQDKSMNGNNLSPWYGSWHDDTSDAWISNQHMGAEGTTALGVLILTPSVFESKPVAYAEARPMSPVEGCSGGTAGQVTFSHSKSFTVDPKRTIKYYKYFFNVPAGTTNYDTLNWSNPDAIVHLDPDEEPVWTYQFTGTYKAVLRVEDDNPNPQHSYYTIDGITVQKSQNIAPTAVITGVAPTVVTAQVVTMKVNEVAYLSGASSTDPNFGCLDTLTYAWDIGDGNGYVAGTSTKNIDVDQVYSLSGTYPIEKTVKLKVTDSGGLWNERTVTLKIYGLVPEAVVEASPNPVACGAPVAFSGSGSKSSIPGKYGLVEYEWDFGDGTTLLTAVNQTSHSYSQYGSYEAKLRVRDNDGAANWSPWDQVTVNVSLGKQNPHASAGGPYIIGSGDSLVLDGTGSYDPDTGCGGGIISYQWDIDGDGDYDEGITGAAQTLLWSGLTGLISPMQYTNPASNMPVYTLKLLVTDSYGATSQSNATLYIYANRPYAVLGSVNPAGCNEQINIDASASYHGYPQGGNYIQSYEIDFGDGTPVFSGNLQFG